MKPTLANVLEASKPYLSKDYDGILVFLPKKEAKAALSVLPEKEARFASQLATSRAFKFKERGKLAGDFSPRVRIGMVVLPEKPAMFTLLELAREGLTLFKERKPKNLLVDLSALAPETARLTDAVLSATIALSYQPPAYGKEKKEAKPFQPEITLRVGAENVDTVRIAANEAEAIAHKTNLVRHLTHRAGNDLTTSIYVDEATRMAKQAGLKTEFFSFDKLKKMGAGAFCAVAQGSVDRGHGILKISYLPKRPERHLAVVGKGITFDTGGNNLKTGAYMFGMNNDMAGSAVALSMVLLAAERQWKTRVTAYMAITDNVLSGHAYRPNDVITSLKGKTIEVIDTDAEGRMVLADTLTLASRDKPDLIIDYATLTGSCVRAIGKNYCGGYSNRKSLLGRIRKAGVASGERVWPFPNDADYGRPLESDIADIKQCRVAGGVDHIEASYFLRQFIENNVPYIHIDLSAMDPEEPLAHIPSKPSGFGVRFTSELLTSLTSHG